MKRPLKRSVHWYSWPEFAEQFDDGQAVLDGMLRSRGGGWSPGGRIELTVYTDRSFETRIPLRKGRVRFVEVVKSGDGR